MENKKVTEWGSIAIYEGTSLTGIFYGSWPAPESDEEYKTWKEGLIPLKLEVKDSMKCNNVWFEYRGSNSKGLELAQLLSEISVHWKNKGPNGEIGGFSDLAALLVHLKYDKVSSSR